MSDDQSVKYYGFVPVSAALSLEGESPTRKDIYECFLRLTGAGLRQTQKEHPLVFYLLGPFYDSGLLS